MHKRLLEVKWLKYLGIILLITFFVLVSYRKSLGLVLYGDDWMVISKYFGVFGPGRQLGYFDKQLFTTNYGPQYIGMALIYAVFKSYSPPYYIVSLVLRVILAFGLFWLVKKMLPVFSSLAVALLFAATSVGAETTNWVYNMNSYLGIFFVLLGLSYFIERKNIKQKTLAWGFMILGYMTVIIRVYVLPLLLFLLKFFEGFFAVGQSNIRKKLFAFLVAVSMLAPFIFIRILFPGMGFQGSQFMQIGSGLEQARMMMTIGRYDFIALPFTSLGRMVVPLGFETLQLKGWQIYPIGNFLFYGGILGILGWILILLSFVKTARKQIIWSGLISFFLLFILKLFVKYQGLLLLKDFPYFAWTFIGMIATTIIVISISRAVLEKDKMNVVFWLMAAVFIFSFLFPWIQMPGFLFNAEHRYLILSSMGIAMAFGRILSPSIKDFKIRNSFFYLRLVLLVALFTVQVWASNVYFDNLLTGRSQVLNDKIFGQIKSSIPFLPTGEATVFYFDNNQPLLYEELFRFGFGYHMQLLYNLEFNESHFPYSVQTKEDLVSAVSNPDFQGRLIGNRNPTPIENVFAFKVDGDRLTNITEQTREFLLNELETQRTAK